MKYKVFSVFTVLALLIALVGFTTPVNAAAYGTNFTTSITYQNVGSASANITLDFYNAESGTAIPIVLSPLSPNASSSIFVGGLSQVASGFKGSAVMSSDQPLVATLVQVPPSGSDVRNRPLSNSFSGGASLVLVPTALKNSFGYTSIVSIQNVDTVAANVKVDFVSTTGAVVTENITNLPSGAAKYYDLGVLGSLGGSFNGSMKLTAVKTGSSTPGSIVATSLELSTNSNGGYAFEGVIQTGTKIYMPSAFCKYLAAGYNSFYAVQNTGTTNVNVTVTYSNSKVDTKVGLAAGAKDSFPGCGKSGSLNPGGFIGSATITATGPIVAVGKITGGGVTSAFNGISVGGSKVAAPYVRYTTANWNNGTRQRAFIAIQNVGSANLASGAVTVKYYDKNGVLVGTDTLGAIPVGGKLSSNPSVLGAVANEFGYYSNGSTGGGAIIQGPSGSQLAVIVRIQSLGTGEDYNGLVVTP